MAKSKNTNPIHIPTESISNSILLIRDQRVMLDFALADLYSVETKILKQAVRRNIDRFPEDFMFQLTKEELTNLRSQFVTSSWGGHRYSHYAFTEQGVAMLSSVLRSPQAVKVNIEIMRAFVRLRTLLESNKVKLKGSELKGSVPFLKGIKGVSTLFKRIKYLGSE